jgi:schlafen family protein
LAANADLDELLAEPREALDVELKEWLDLTDHDHRAMIAKEIIALANHGGGYLVVGFKEDTDGSFAPARPRPTNLEAWSQDEIQSIVAKYVDPTVQCKVIHRPAPGSADRYPTIIVPGGHRIPIRARSGSPDGKKLVPHRAYIRRPGPNSEEPRTAEEWDRLLERCLQNRKTELLEAMRSIMAGVVPTAPAKTPLRYEELVLFEKAAIERWEARIANLPAGVSPRFPHGYFDVAIAIDGSLDTPSLPNLRNIIATEVRNHSGWPPFLTVDRAPFAPKPVDGAVEFWRGPEDDGSCDVPAHHDFWRASPSGLFFTRRGYQEDGLFGNMEPGRFFDIVAPTRRIGETILEAVYIARALKTAEANLICRCQWRGLEGRLLVSRANPNRLLSGNYKSAQGAYGATQTVALDALPGALPEAVFDILAPLYVLFDFFALPKRLVEEELASLQRNLF